MHSYTAKATKYHNTQAGNAESHMTPISLSYRTRGYAARKRISLPKRRVTKRGPLLSRTAPLIKQKKIMRPYSARNRSTNPPLLYSILNPEISSDSPSLKSRGARLHSATTLNIQIGANHTRRKGPLRTKSPLWDPTSRRTRIKVRSTS